MLLPSVSKMATSFQALSIRLTWPKRMVRKDNPSFVYVSADQILPQLFDDNNAVPCESFTLFSAITSVHVHVLHERMLVEHFNV